MTTGLKSDLKSPGSPRIPQELCEAIIDYVGEWSHFWSRGTTLCACALTCRAWYPRARIHMLRMVFKSGAVTLRAFKEGMRRSRTDAERVERFSAYNEIGHLVPITLQNLLQGLSTLSFLSQSWKCLHPAFFVTVAQFKHVRYLELSAIMFYGLRDLTRLLASLSALKGLSIINSKFLSQISQNGDDAEEGEQQGPPPPLILPSPPSANGRRKPLAVLEHFRYIDCHDEDLELKDQSCSLLLWMAEAGMARSITTLKMEMVLGRYAKENAAAHDFLDSCTSLKSLILLKDNVHGDRIVKRGLHWPKSITSITLIMDDEQETRDQFNALVKSLSTCPEDVARNIHTICFRVHLPYSHLNGRFSSTGTDGLPVLTFEPHRLEKSIWEPIDSLASREGRAKWKALSTVKVTAEAERGWGIFFASDWESEVEGAVDLTRKRDAQEFLERRLPQLWATGVRLVPKFRMVPSHYSIQEDRWKDD